MLLSGSHSSGTALCSSLLQGQSQAGILTARLYQRKYTVQSSALPSTATLALSATLHSCLLLLQVSRLEGWVKDILAAAYVPAINSMAGVNPPSIPSP